VAILGLASRYQWVTLPEQFRAFDNDFIIATAIGLFVIEFIADKIPWFDSVWDTIHTAVRPIGGALIAVTTLGEASPTMEAFIALMGGSVAATTHFSKAGTRAIANTSPEPFSNWFLSIAEDGFVIGLSLIALKYPVLAAAVVVVGLIIIAIFAAVFVRAIRKWMERRRAAAPLRA
jgi:hypothetical protein